MKKILITGINSYVGNAFEYYLRSWPQEYHVTKMSMRDGEWRNKSFSEYDVVFHVAGIAHSDNGRVSEERARGYYTVNTELTIELAKKAKADGVKQFIFMSSASVYGKSTPIGTKTIITKQTQPRPENTYGDSKWKAEQGIMPLQDENFNVVVLRPPMIYGPKCRGNYQTLVTIAKITPIFPDINNIRSMLYIEHLVTFVRLMIDNQEHGIFWPQNEEYTNTSKMVKTISDAYGRKTWLVPGFSGILKTMGHFTGLVDKAFGSLIYDQAMSKYKVPYCKKTLAESIKETEGML